MDTDIDRLPELLARQRAAHHARVPDLAQRRDDLDRLRTAFKAQLETMAEQVSADFGRRSRHETLISDGMTVLNEIDHLRAGLRGWMRPKRVGTRLLFWPGRSEIRYQPLGVVGIISPWNYPVNLALMPLAAALAAGNHVLLKPSELTPRTSAFLAELLGSIFPPERVAVVQGGADVASAFASLPFDHLFFTGSTAVGRKVMAAAAPNLTPVTLELGGKSPAIIAPDYPLDQAIARIASGKFLNAGQTCIAPDYVMVPRGQAQAFAAGIKTHLERAYPDLADNADYTSIVSESHFGRLHALCDDARERGAEVLTLLPGDAQTLSERRLFPPTLVLKAPDESRVMTEEIFGPILPVLEYDRLDDALARIAAGERPLALYHFDHDRVRTRRVLDQTISGGVCINDTVMHIAQDQLPFGGVGASGMGHYHGHHGFLALSKQKAVFYQGRFSGMALFRPPYRKLADRLVQLLTR